MNGLRDARTWLRDRTATARAALAEKLGAVARSPADRTSWRASLREAVVFDLAQHARNRLAMTLVVLFIPTWIGVTKAVLPDRRVVYHSQAAGRALSVPADELVTISGAINAVTLIIGFMMFTAAHRSGDFERRLVLAGYSKSALLPARLVGLLLISGVVAAYAAAVMALHWDPRHVWAIAFSLFISGLTYGGLGVVLGLAVSNELSGMFVIIMVSLVEVMIQNPVTNPSSDQTFVRFAPTYGPMQSGATSGFTDQASWGHSLLGLLWLAAFGSIATIAFHRRTRDHTGRDLEPVGATRTPAVVTLSTRADGSFEVLSATGPVVFCSQLPRCPAGCGEETTEPPQPRHRNRRTTTTTGPPARQTLRDKTPTTTLDRIKAAPLVR